MSKIIGFINEPGKEHRLSNPLDGKLFLSVWFDKAAGETALWVNGTRQCISDAGAEQKPYLCGVVELPRGEFTVRAESGCTIEKILLFEEKENDVLTEEQFDTLFANRSGQWVFERPEPDYTPEMLALLRRHGFLFKDTNDCAVGKMPSGIPLGGFGCGKVEICEDGMLTAFTGNNNQDSPLYRMPGSFFALSAGGATRILQKTEMGLPYTPVETVEHDFVFPFANLRYQDSALPVEAELSAFAPHIPGNADDSALPVVFWDVTLTNRTENEQKAAFAFSWENLINVGGSMSVANGGERIFPLCFHTWNGSFVWSDRRGNTGEKQGDVIRFSASDDRGNPMSFGEHLLYCCDRDAEAVPDRALTDACEKQFIAHLEDPAVLLEIQDATEFRAGAWIVRRTLAPGESQKVRFVLCWYMPTLVDANGENWSVYYTTKFASAQDILRYALENRDRLYTETHEMQDIMRESSLPLWVQNRLLDDRFVVSTCSWFDKYGNFSINEAPTGMGGCLGTLDQRTASQCYYTAFFPELDAHELDLFRLTHNDDGMCAHEIGFASINPKGRVISQWPDLAAAYIIQVYHTYQRTGDRSIVDLHWEQIKKAIAWTLTMDDMHTAIPYTCPGRGNTYDNQFWEGINSFVTSMQIAAYRIAAAMGDLEGETGLAEEWRMLAKQAEAFRMEHLWNQEAGYFNNAFNMLNGEIDDSCFVASLAGDWALERAGIGSHIGHKRMAETADVITSYCMGEHGMTDQGGRRDTTQGFTQYPTAYLASAALYAGNTHAADRVLETTETVITNPECSNHYNQALTYAFNGERAGLPYYMTAPSTWNMLDAAVGLRVDREQGTLALAPTGEGVLKIPVFLPDAWFWVERSAEGNTLAVKPIRSVGNCPIKKLTVAGTWHTDIGEVAYGDGATVVSACFDPGKDTLVLQA